MPLTSRSSTAPRSALRLCCHLAALFLLIAGPGSSQAADIPVNTNDDAGPGSLREALNIANALPGDDTIIFNLPQDSIILLVTSLPNITENLEIDGDTAAGLTISGNGTQQIFRVGRLVPTGPTVTATVTNVDLANGLLQIGDGDILAFNQGVDATFADVITDKGALEKLGAATLILTGANDYEGGTFVRAGTLQGDSTSLQGTIDNEALVLFNQAEEGTFEGTISGSGGLSKTGVGTLIMTGENDYEGGTRVRQGALSGRANQLDMGNVVVQGSLQGNITTEMDTLVIFTQDADTLDGTYAGDMSGSGGLVKEGPNTLFLTGTNTYSGGTTLNGGAISSNNEASIQGDIVTQTGTEVIFITPTDQTYGGDMSGGGALVKEGGDTLRLEGTNSYTGGTELNDGNLIGDAEGITGDIVTAMGTNVIFELPTGSGTHNGAISAGINGGGSVFKQGTGLLTVQGPITVPIFVTVGTLQGDTVSLKSDVSVQGNASDPDDPDNSVLAFNQEFNGTFVDRIIGAGRLEKSGSGTVVVMNSQTSFTGPVSIIAGRLDVNGQVNAAEVTVDSGATLGGTGNLIAADVTVNGTVAPGSSIGTLRAATVTFNPGSLLEVEVEQTGFETGVADLLDVGTANLDELAQVVVIPGPGEYEGNGVEVDILTAVTKNGDFADDPLPTDLAFLAITLIQNDPMEPNTVSLLVKTNGASLADVAQTENQKSVANGLTEAEDNGSNGDLQTISDSFRTLRTSEVGPALDAMSGEQITGLTTTRLAVNQHLHASLQERIRDVAEGVSDPLFARSGAAAVPLLVGAPQGVAALAGSPALLPATLGAAGPSAEVPATPFGAWLDGYGLFGNVDGSSNTSELDYTVWGVSAGFDYRFSMPFILGLAGGYASSDLDYKDRSGSPEANTYQAALYGGYMTPKVQAGAAFRFAYNDMESSRRIAFGTGSAAIDRTAKADFDGIDLGGHIEAAVNLFEVVGLSFQPLAAFDYAYIQRDDFTEKGAGSLNLDVDEETLHSIVSELGLRLHGRYNLGENIWLRPELHARWAHQFGDRDRKINGTIGGIPGGGLTVVGTELARDSIVVGTSWTATITGNLNAYVDYDAILNSKLVEHAAAIGLRIAW